MGSLLSTAVKDSIFRKHLELRETGAFLPADELTAAYARFRERFGPQRIQHLQGKALLDDLFLHGNKQSLVYWLEFKNDDELPNRFGGIGGGSAYKFILFKQKDSGQWVTGSPRIPQVITEVQAIELATLLRDQFVACCKVLDTLHDDSTFDEYLAVNAKLRQVGDRIHDKAFAHKYFSLLYPALIDDYHALKFQHHQLLSMGIDDSRGRDRYERAYFFKEVRRDLGIPMNELTCVLSTMYGLPRNYWRIGSSFNDDTNLWPVFRDEGVVAIGWSALGDLKDLGATAVAKAKLAERLKNEFGTTHGPTASRKAGEIINFRHHIQTSDIVVAASGKTVLGIGEVQGEYYHEPGAALDTTHRIDVSWVLIPGAPLELPISGEVILTSCKQLNRPENHRFLEDILRSAVPMNQAVVEPKKRAASPENPPWSPRVHQIKGVLDRKGQVILYGPPGTGKTHWARIAAREMVSWSMYHKNYEQLSTEERVVIDGGEDKDGLVRICTFHPAYGYEDFLEGYRPKGNAGALSFELRDGIFKRLCRDAAKAPDYPHILLVDEINRGDIPRIFGELITLLELDKRNMAVRLPTSGESFSVPPNVFVIGTMNTADRSIALLDTALRRRFGFLELQPELELLKDMVLEGFPVGVWLKLLNAEIREKLGNDGRNLQVGHAYFMHKGQVIAQPGLFAKVLLEDVIPLLEEYFYDMPEHLPELLGGKIMDTKEQCVRRELFDPTRREELFEGLINGRTELSTSPQAILADAEKGDEEAETEDENVA